jgi:hypothetical protein
VRFILPVFSLFLSSISGNPGQLLFILRLAGQPFSRPSSHVVNYAPKGRPQHVCIDSRNSFSYHTTILPFSGFFRSNLSHHKNNLLMKPNYCTKNKEKRRKIDKMGCEITTCNDSQVLEKKRVFSFSHKNCQMTWIIKS